MTSSDITITHHLTGKGTGQLTAGQQQQLSALVPADATTKTRTEDGGVLTAAKWTWTATWSAEQDQAWRAKTADAVLPPAAWAAVLQHVDLPDPRPAPAPGTTGITNSDMERFVAWCARQLDTTPIDVKMHFYVATEDDRFVLVARRDPDPLADGTSIARELWGLARAAGITQGGLLAGMLASSHHHPQPYVPTPTMADGKTPRCQAVSDGTHGYVAGSQCTRVSGHDTHRNIVGHYYPRKKPKES